MQLLLVSLATLWAWESLRGILPFAIPARLAPFCVVLVAWGLTFIHGSLIIAGASAGAVAILRVLAKAGPLPPWKLYLPSRKISLPPGARGNPPSSQVGKRVPKL